MSEKKLYPWKCIFAPHLVKYSPLLWILSFILTMTAIVTFVLLYRWQRRREWQTEQCASCKRGNAVSSGEKGKHLACFLWILLFSQRKHFSSFVYFFKHFFSLNITFWVLTHETSGETRLLKSIHICCKVSLGPFSCQNLIIFQKETSLAEGFGGATRWDLMGTLAAHYFAPIGRIYQLWFDFCILILNLYSYSTL